MHNQITSGQSPIRSGIRRILLSSLVMLGCGCGTTLPVPNQLPKPILEGNKTMLTAPWKTAAGLQSYCDESLETAKAIRAELIAGKSGDVLGRYNELLQSVDTSMGWASLMFQVNPTEAIRKTAGECKQRLAEFGNDSMLDRGLFDALNGVSTSGLDDETKRYHSHIMREFKRSGVDKNDAQRARLKTIHGKMVELGQLYQTNVREDVRSITVDDAKALDGLPADWIANHKPGPDGKITVTTDYPDFIPFETYSTNGALRKTLYDVFMQRGFPKNKPIFKELLTLRHEYAGMLGYPTWAAYNAADKMVKTAERVDEFIRELGEIARPRAKEDLKVLLKRKQVDVKGASAIEVWDRFYYLGKVREESYGFDAQAVRPYFPYEQVKNGIMEIYAELFGIEFVALPDAPVWDPQVDAYELRMNGERIAAFYLDMHARAGKYKHAAMFGVQTGLVGGRLPMASLVCNFPDPKDGDGNALMEHTQVQTFFHEFGHLLHHLLARGSRYANLGGINVEWDFVEAPSQLLEEWGWAPEVLGRFAKHVDTGAVIPTDMITKMRESDEFGKGVGVLRQLFYTAYSFYSHNRDPATLDLDEFTDEIYRDYSPYPRIKDGKVYANFGHLIGYSSMYYTYQWSLVIAKDLFTRFNESGLMDKTVAREYRERILEPGGMRDAAELVRDFLGRDYSLDAYKKWLVR
ncbi:MAG: thimet oligopeptidase [Myxococcota bacterium]|jgi:thimet oligopeptidase